MSYISPIVRKRLREWSKFHIDCTIREAFDHCKKMDLAVEDRHTVKTFVSSQTSIRVFLTTICGYARTNERRDGYVVYKRPGADVRDQAKSDRYFGLLQRIWDDDAI